MGYDGIAGTNYEPILESVGCCFESDFEKNLEMLKHLEEIVWKFIVLLNELGIDISTDDINLRDDWLINLEESKYEIERNTKALLDAGLAIEVI